MTIILVIILLLVIHQILQKCQDYAEKINRGGHKTVKLIFTCHKERTLFLTNCVALSFLKKKIQFIFKINIKKCFFLAQIVFRHWGALSKVKKLILFEKRLKMSKQFQRIRLQKIWKQMYSYKKWKSPKELYFSK